MVDQLMLAKARRVARAKKQSASKVLLDMLNAEDITL
ncbi:MAG: hypothetical protein ACJAYC_000962 [Halieaceae bacterium]|jgi:hypothetical protein